MLSQDEEVDKVADLAEAGNAAALAAMTAMSTTYKDGDDCMDLLTA